MAINYNQDIAPLRQQYFPMLMGERGFDQAMKYRQEVIMPMRKQTLDLQSQMIRIKNQELSNQQLTLNLDKSRRDAKFQMDMMDRMPAVMEDITSIIENPNTDHFSKNKEIAMYRMGLSPKMQNSPELASIFSSAVTAVGQDQAKEKQESALKTSARARKLGQIHSMLQSGNIKAAQEVIGSTIEEDEEGLSAWAASAAEQKKAAAELKEATREETRRQEVIGNVEELEKTILALKPKSPKGSGLAVAVTEGTVGQAPPQPTGDKTFQWAETDKGDLVRYYKLLERLNKEAPDPKIGEKGEEELRDMILEKINEFKLQQGVFGRPSSDKEQDKVDADFGVKI